MIVTARSLVLLLVLAPGDVWGRDAERLAGRPLAEVLVQLRKEGMPLVFSDRVVEPGMTVLAEPKAASARGRLEELLAPHGLRVQEGPKDRLLVVPRAEAPGPGPRGGSVRVRLRRGRTREPLIASGVEFHGDDGVAGVSPDGHVVVRDLGEGLRYFRLSVPGYADPGALPALVRRDQAAELVFDLDSGDGRPAGPLTIDLTSMWGVDHREAVEVTTPGPAGVGPSTFAFRPAELMKGAGHSGNLLTPLLSLPGVKTGRSFDGRLVVRGGAPDQGSVVVDGALVLSPYHVFGMSSVFLPASVESLEFSAGGFDVRHGDRLSSLLSVTTHTGAGVDRPTGHVGVDLFDADLALEGKLPGVDRGSWLVAGRYSLVDLLATSVLDAAVPHFADLWAKLSWERRPGQRVSWLSTFGWEELDYRERDDDLEDWTLRTRIPAGLTAVSFESALGARAVWRAVASYGGVHDDFDMRGDVVSDSRGTAEDSPPEDGRVARVALARETGISDVGLRGDLTLRPSARHAWDVGLEAHWLRTRWCWDVTGDRSYGLANRSLPLPYGVPGAALPSALDSALSYSRLGAWIQDRVTLRPSLAVLGGLRLDRSGLTGDLDVSPRFSAVLGLGASTRLRASVGAYSQSPGYEKVLQSDYFVDLGAAPDLRNEKARHAAISLERDLGRGFTTRLEVYRKSYADLVVGRLETEEERRARVARHDFGPLSPFVPTEPQITATPVNGASGLVHGVDVQVARNEGGDARVTGWVSYSYGVARENAYGHTFPFDYDRRHALSAVARWQARPTLAVSGTLRIASGSPWTEPAGLTVAGREDTLDVDADGDVDEILPARDSQGRLVFTHDMGGVSRINADRLPVYARLDARVTYAPRGPDGRWSFHLDLINVLNRDNPGLMACRVGGGSAKLPAVVQESDFSIPFLPSFGLRLRF